MTPTSTFLEAMRNAAATAGTDRGFRYYSSPTDAEFVSYAELERQGRADAAALAAGGHRPGDVAVLAFEPGLGFIRSLYAAFAAGLVAAPVPVAAMRHPEAARHRLEAIVADSRSRLVLTEGAALSPLGIAGGDSVAGARVVDLSTLGGSADDWRPPAIDADSLALLQYTSGSTGVPKGVMVSHGNLVANEAAITGAVGITASSSTVGWLPHYHDMGLVGQLLQPISVAADSVLTSPSQFLRRPLLWLRLITEHRSTHTVGPDFAYGLCTRLVSDEQLAGLDLASLEGVITGAEPVRSPTLAAFAARFAPAGFRAAAFVPAYGMAETTLLVTASVRDGAVTPITVDAGALEAGHLRPGTDGHRTRRARVLRSAGRGPRRRDRRSGDGRPRARRRDRRDPRARPERRPGLLEPAAGDVGGVRRHDHGRSDRLRYLRTGDLGALVDGELVITGRLKDLIIIRGRNLYPQDLETTAEALLHSGCLSAAFEGMASQPQVGPRRRSRPRPPPVRGPGRIRRAGASLRRRGVHDPRARGRAHPQGDAPAHDEREGAARADPVPPGRRSAGHRAHRGLRRAGDDVSIALRSVGDGAASRRRSGGRGVRPVPRGPARRGIRHHHRPVDRARRAIRVPGRSRRRGRRVGAPALVRARGARRLAPRRARADDDDPAPRRSRPHGRRRGRQDVPRGRRLVDRRGADRDDHGRPRARRRSHRLGPHGAGTRLRPLQHGDDGRHRRACRGRRREVADQQRPAVPRDDGARPHGRFRAEGALAGARRQASPGCGRVRHAAEGLDARHPRGRHQRARHSPRGRRARPPRGTAGTRARDRAEEPPTDQAPVHGALPRRRRSPRRDRGGVRRVPAGPTVAASRSSPRVARPSGRRWPTRCSRSRSWSQVRGRSTERPTRWPS